MILRCESWERELWFSLRDWTGTRALRKKLDLPFDTLTDLHLKIAEQFGLVFTLPDYLRDLYGSWGNTLDRFHDEPEYRLGMPARYIVDSNSITRAADVNADYTICPEPSETLRLLKEIVQIEPGPAPERIASSHALHQR